jgi:hypothetical protein
MILKQIKQSKITPNRGGDLFIAIELKIKIKINSFSFRIGEKGGSSFRRAQTSSQSSQ